MRPTQPYINAGIFDYDGTLFYLNIDFARMRFGVETLLSECGIEPGSLNGLLILEMIDEATRRIFERNPSKAKILHQKALELVAEHEVAAAKKGHILPGVIEMLKLLKEKGIKVAIITRNCEKAVKIGFPAVERFCDVFLPRDCVRRVKPHPDHLLLTLERLGANSPARCLVVGDHVLDIEGGKRVGMKTAGVLTGKTTAQGFSEVGADFIVEDATRIPDCIFRSPCHEG